ncbi:GlxA family transcriptional regulator [Variovorax atrisoli]|uniref:GlxA family transcriptional regulator n=1 Tax=Variovorax atrisoli TaxID=3394203 RepID=UPI00119A6367|nr:helix-turn-helix domain-containing protein [Variovorax paradoxus]MDR6521185.1 transcriptional regulator GlxA family with amidase domain [Variovorax paradoxus]
MHTVWFLLLPGFPLVDVSGMLAVFEGANALRHSGAEVAGYAVRLISIEGRAVCSSSGVLLAAQVLPHRLEGNANSLVIAGGPRAGSEPAGTSDVQRLQGWFSNNQQHLVRCAAVDVDALALTPTSAPARQRANPVSASWLALKARRSDWTAASPVSPRWRYIEAGQGTDLALSWLEADQGSAFADTLAERLPEPRSRRYGPMRYRSSLIDHPAPDPRIAMLHAWIAAHLHEKLDVARLAQRFPMSTRSFTRLYSRATGLTPAHGVQQIRLDTACRLIEAGTRPLKTIAAQCGYSSQEVMRRTFLRVLGMTPREYRQHHMIPRSEPDASR